MYSMTNVISSGYRTLAVAFCASILMAVGAQISVPFYPVPFTLQTLALLLVAACFDARTAVYSVLMYLAEGAIGLPVFANFSSGVHVLFGPTGGYLLGFIPGVYLASAISNKFSKLSATFVGGIIGSAVILAFGTVYLATFVGLDNALKLGVYPFLLGDLLKVILCTSIYKHISKK